MAGNYLSEEIESPYARFRRVTRIFVSPDRIHNGIAELSESQVRHLSRVLRKIVGDEIAVLDNLGNAWMGILREVRKNWAQVELTSCVPNPETDTRRVELVIPPLKGEKMDFILQKGTEIGVTAFHIVPMERSIARMHDSSGSKLARYRSIVISAAEQCGGFTFPILIIWDGLAAFLDKIGPVERYIAWEQHWKEMKEFTNRQNPLAGGSESCILASGPEGGFSLDEIKRWASAGFQPISLGTRVLRAETAPIVMAALALCSKE